MKRGSSSLAGACGLPDAGAADRVSRVRPHGQRTDGPTATPGGGAARRGEDVAVVPRRGSGASPSRPRPHGRDHVHCRSGRPHALRYAAEVDELPRSDAVEYSSGTSRHQGGITKAGNGHARRALVEGAWAYRYPAKVSRHLQLRLEHVSTEVRAIAWKAQVRLCERYRLLSARGKHVNQVVVAIAREMAAFALGARTVPVAS